MPFRHCICFQLDRFSRSGSGHFKQITRDSNNSASTSTALIETVNKYPTNTVLTVTPNAATVGQTITLKADVSGPIPTSLVTFMDGATTLGTGTLSGTGSTASATFTTSFSTMGAHSITAVYAGDADDAVSTSSASSITISAPNVPPTVSITAPANNASYTAPASFTLLANAADSDGTITKVDFYNGATLLASVTSAPYSFNVTGLAVGTYSFTAVATDNSNATTTSAMTQVTIVAPNVPPTISITAPANNSSYPIPATVTVTITANASDSDGTISKVDFYNGATLMSTVTAAPYSVTLAGFTAGSYTFTAVATDNSNASTTSSAVTISVTAANMPPSVSIITPADSSSVTLPATVTIAANATDSDGTISKVDFYSNATLMSTVTAAPYSVTLAGFNLGSYTFTAVATDNSNASTTSAPVSISIVSGTPQVYYIHTDQLNTPRLITDSNNTPVWRWDAADPFGNNPPNDDPQGTGRHFEFNQRFAGQYFDKETNTFYNYFRDYDPQTDTYRQSDLVGLRAGINTYSYALQNPLSYTDPLGLDTYVMSRDLSAFGSSARPLTNTLTHTLTFSTNPDGSVSHTYSWGNDANLKGWNLDQPIDLKTASEALKKGLAEKVAPDFMDGYYRKAFDKLNVPENNHSNWIITNNCKTETVKLNKFAWKLWSNGGDE